jgi:hypothetical protein
MNASERKRAGNVWFWVAVLLFLAGIVYVVVSAFTGSTLLNARDDAPLLILGLANTISLAGWWRARTGLREAERSERERLEDELREREKDETAAEIGQGSRAAAATWRPGETGDEVIARARADLRN